MKEESDQIHLASTAGHDLVKMLTFKTLTGRPCAVPLSLVYRLEEFNVKDIETSGRHLVSQYDGGLLPLMVWGSEQLSPDKQGSIPTILFSDGSRTFGLLVDSIMDVSEEELAIEESLNVPGIYGVSIIRGVTTELMDVYHFYGHLYPEIYGILTASRSNPNGKRVLVVEDSQFFRKLISSLMESLGFTVSCAVDGQDAWQKIKTERKFDLVLSDIEMPRMDGWGLVTRIREHPEMRGVPVLALTSLNGPEAVKKGKERGFTDYLVKFDKHSVASTVERIMSTAGVSYDRSA